MTASPFSPQLPTFQTAWDSTSLGWLKTCPKLYEYQMLQGWEPRNRGIHLTFGGLYASALERYAHSRASGLDHHTSTRVMVRWALEHSGERDCAECRGVGWIDLQPDSPLPIANHTHARCIQCGGTGGEFHPWTPTEPDANIKNRYTLLRSLVWNVEERETSPFKTLILSNGKPATELTFDFKFMELGGDEITLNGHLDEVVYELHAPEARWVRDDKTTKGPLGAQYFAQYSPNNQMSLYSVAGRIILDAPVRGVLVKAAQIGVGFTRFQTAQVPRPPAVLDEWMADTRWWIGQARRFAEEDHWPLNDRSCFLCAFKSVCKVSPSHREAHLREDFVQRGQWNPLDKRGDV